MANTISLKLSSKFDLILRVKKADGKNIEKMLVDNQTIFFVEPCPFAGFTIIIIPSIKLAKAEMIRRLIQNIQVYD